MEYKRGALPPQIDIRDYKYAPAGVSKEVFPSFFKLWTPPIKNQDTVNSCVAHASAEIEEYFNYKEGKEHKPLSVGYIYGCRYSYTGEGMYLRDALKTLKDRGISTHEEFPYNEEVPKMIQLFNSKSEWKTDKKHKITSYFQISPTNKKDMKSCLMKNGPIMVSIPWYDDFKVSQGRVVSNSNLSVDYGYHAVVIYGWDDLNGGWLLQNSWGTNWGNNGCAIYPYDYPIREAWGITDIENNPDIKQPKDIKIAKPVNAITNGIIKLFKKCKI